MILGREAGRADALLRVLTRKFGRLPVEVEARVRSGTHVDVEHWLDARLGGATLAECLLPERSRGRTSSFGSVLCSPG